ncbi:MAG: hypothetical protein H6739_11795 [Alphaproteobacteria bacterium]|nr:hypothetical protein [Alphaproteobacteria bacterium]
MARTPSFRIPLGALALLAACATTSTGGKAEAPAPPEVCVQWVDRVCSLCGQTDPTCAAIRDKLTACAAEQRCEPEICASSLTAIDNDPEGAKFLCTAGQ